MSMKSDVVAIKNLPRLETEIKKSGGRIRGVIDGQYAVVSLPSKVAIRKLKNASAVSTSRLKKQYKFISKAKPKLGEAGRRKKNRARRLPDVNLHPIHPDDQEGN